MASAVNPNPLRVAVVTHFASPYQVELFDAISRDGRVAIDVFYLHQTFVTRQWKANRMAHKAHFLDENTTDLCERDEVFSAADLVVFNTYAEEPAYHMLWTCAKSGRPWCFWGERPGFSHLGWLGRVYRFWRLSALRRSKAAIWGIGKFAVEGYQKEFGNSRRYENVPYFSDLQRFQQKPAGHAASATGHRVILYSGSLCRRKGADLLAAAFAIVAAQHPWLHLKILGDGPLRGSLERKLKPVKGQVQFLGFQQWEALPSVYWTAHVLCVPSRYDGWALVVPEGLAAGLPVIGTDRTGAAIELIEPRVNGWIIKAGRLAPLVHVLEEVATLSDATLAQYSEVARQSVGKHSLAQGAERFIRACQTATKEWATT